MVNMEDKISKAERKSRATSCERCKRRKQRCDHRLPTCTNCLKAGAVCVQPEKYVQHVPVKDEYTVLLEARVARLEDELRRSGQSGSSTDHNGLITKISPRSPLSNSASQHGSPAVSHGPNPSFAHSFSVVSSLLQDSFWSGAGTPEGSSNTHTNTNGTNGIVSSDKLLMDYELSNYIKILPGEPSDERADALIDYFMRNQGKFAHLDAEAVQELHRDRKTPGDPHSPRFRFRAFVLYSIYALSAMLMTSNRAQCRRMNGSEASSRATGGGGVNGSSTSASINRETGSDPDPLSLYSTALRHASLCRTKDPLMRIQALILCATFQMRTDLDAGTHFDMVIRALKLCAEAGLHTEQNDDQPPKSGLKSGSLRDQELRRRLFWSVYGLERLFAISTGRPFALSEAEITVPLPVDLDLADLKDDEKILEARAASVSTPLGGVAIDVKHSTSLTFAIYVWQLRRIESRMVTDIYLSRKPPSQLYPVMEMYLDELRQWRDLHAASTDQERDVAAIGYSKAVRLLLQPFLANEQPHSELFQLCVSETASICNTFRSFYKVRSGYTTIAMHTNFIAGLTLVYTLWLARGSKFLPILESIRVCTATLYVLTERSRLCKNYRDTFERLVEATVQALEEINVDGRSDAASPALTVKSSVSGPSSSSVFMVPTDSTKAAATSMPPSSDTVLTTSMATPPIIADDSPLASSAAAAPASQPLSLAFDQASSSQQQPEEYFYDDTMYNMIQHISSWTRTNPNAVPERDVPESMWLNFTDFSLS